MCAMGVEHDLQAIAHRGELLVWIDLSIGVGCFTAISLFLLSSRSVTVDQGLRG